MQHLSLIHQLFHRTGNILDRHLRIDAMLIEKVNVVGAEALQGRFDGSLYVIRLAVQATFHLTSLGVDVEAELRRDLHAVSERGNALAKDALALQRSICLSRVEEGHALIMSGSDERHHFGAVWRQGVELPAHILHAEAQARDRKRAELSLRGKLRGGILVG